MAEFHMNDPFCSVNSVDLSDHVVSVELAYGSETLDVTAGGDAVRNFIAGLKTITCSVTFNQDFAASKTYITLYSLVGAAGTAVSIGADATASISATNPRFNFTAFPSSLPLVTGAVGSAMQISVPFIGQTDITVATS